METDRGKASPGGRVKDLELGLGGRRFSRGGLAGKPLFLIAYCRDEKGQTPSDQLSGSAIAGFPKIGWPLERGYAGRPGLPELTARTQAGARRCAGNARLLSVGAVWK